MAAQGPRRPRRVRHQWSTTADTRRSILDAARTIFGKHGFADANVAEIVELAGSSVGSLYHHFGGKSELFGALWEQHRKVQRDLADAAVADATEHGVDDPWALFLVGVRATLEHTWEDRDLIRLFYEGDTPTGFGKELTEYRRSAAAGLLKALALDDETRQRATGLVLTSVVTEARREIARSRSAADARSLVNSVMDVLDQLRTLVTGPR